MLKKTILPALLVAFSTAAQAQVSEVHFGFNTHDMDWTGLGNGADKERSTAINGQVVFDQPDFLKWALSPHPYFGGALNLDGKSSFGGGGLTWRHPLFENIYADLSFGLAVHDGTLEVKPSNIVQSVIDNASEANNFTAEQSAIFAADLADFRARQQSEIDFGSRVLFRQQIAFGYRWSNKWSTQIFR